MQSKRNRRSVTQRAQGFTLVEIILAMAILFVLSAVVWMAVAGRVKSAGKRTALKSDLRQIVMAVNMYRIDNDGGLPSDWHHFGYYAVNRKDKFGPGFPPHDLVYANPPSYDVSYHTPECAAPPKASPAFHMFSQWVNQFASRTRAGQIDVEHDQAVRFEPACLANSFGKHPVRFMRDGVVVTRNMEHRKSLGADLSGTLSYQWLPDWILEIILGN